MSNPSEIRFTVIVPVYNAAKYLRECLDSLINQTLRQIEIICINDGSLDESLSILNEYAKKDMRIKVYSQENKGVSAARNVGLDNACGELIVFVDADDYVETDMLHILSDTANRELADIVVFGGNSFPKVDWIEDKLSIKKKNYNYDSINALFNEKGSRPFICNKAYSRKLLGMSKAKFNEKLILGEDQAFQFLVFPHANKISYIPNCLYHYRQSNVDSTMSSYSKQADKKTQAHVAMVEYIIDVWEKEKITENYGCDLANWTIQYLYTDILSTNYNVKVALAKTILSWFETKLEKSLLNSNSLEKYHTLQEIANNAEKSPKISIIMPAFNAENYIEECLKSLIKQTFECFELICVDDGSTDNTVNIIEKFLQKDSRIKLIKQKHCFAGIARNAGIDKSRGDYLLFLDADDFFEPTLLEESYNQILKYDADICVFQSDTYDEKAKIFRSSNWTCNLERAILNRTFSIESNAKNIYWFTTAAPWNKLFRKEFIEAEKLRFQGIRSANDLLFVYTALSCANKIIVLDKILTHYRINNSTSLQATQHKDPLTCYYAVRGLKDELVKRDKFSRVENAFNNFALDCFFYNLQTIKNRDAFEQMYFAMKNQILPEFGLDILPDEYFYAYKVNHIIEKRRDIMNFGVLEFTNKYNLFVKTVEVYKPIHSNKLEKNEAEKIRSSMSYKIGRFVTWLPRKIRGGIKCYKDNGIKYTVLRFLEKIHLM